MHRRFESRLRLCAALGGAAFVSVVVAASGAGCVSSSTNPPQQSPLDAGLSFLDTSTGPFDANRPGNDSSTPTGNDAATGDDASQGGCSGGWVQGQDGNCYVDLRGAWAPSTDANSDGPDTVATLGAVTATSVSVVQSHTGTDYADCGCNAQHLNIPLGKSFDCASATLEFVYATTTTMTGTNSPGLDVRFCNGACPSVDGGAGGPYFWTGPQYVGGPFAPGTSSCAYEWENDAGTASLNYFPASAKITSGQKTSIALGSYVAPASGDACTGTFDTIDVHLQVYNCAAAESGTSTLSNLRIY